MSEPFIDETKKDWEPKKMHGGLTYRGASSRRQLNLKIQDIKTQVEKHREESQLDYLTNIFNKRGVLNEFERIRGILNRNEGDYKGFSVIVLDMIGLKAMNENPEIGEKVADQVLKNAASAMSEGRRGSDVVGRWGGDEFVYIDINSDKDKIPQLIHRILDGMPGDVHFNIGFRTFDGSTTNIEESITSVVSDVNLKVKKMGPVDETGRSIGLGTVVDLETMEKINV